LGCARDVDEVRLTGLDFPAGGSALADSLLSDQATMSQPAETTLSTPAKIETSGHSFDSSLREQALVHLLLGLLLAFMWRNGGRETEVLKSEVIAADIMWFWSQMASFGTSSFQGSKVREVDVSTKLLRKPGGCILWLEFGRESLTIEGYYWFGGKARDCAT
jgi:hypothetical protein